MDVQKRSKWFSFKTEKDERGKWICKRLVEVYITKRE